MSQLEPAAQRSKRFKFKISRLGPGVFDKLGIALGAIGVHPFVLKQNITQPELDKVKKLDKELHVLRGAPRQEKCPGKAERRQTSRREYDKMIAALVGVPSFVQYCISRPLLRSSEQEDLALVKRFYTEYYWSVVLAREPALLKRVRDALARHLSEFNGDVLQTFEQLSDVQQWIDTFKKDNAGQIMHRLCDAVTRVRPLPKADATTWRASFNDIWASHTKLAYFCSGAPSIYMQQFTFAHVMNQLLPSLPSRPDAKTVVALEKYCNGQGNGTFVENVAEFYRLFSRELDVGTRVLTALVPPAVSTGPPNNCKVTSKKRRRQEAPERPALKPQNLNCISSKATKMRARRKRPAKPHEPIQTSTDTDRRKVRVIRHPGLVLYNC